jgi:hypothetical protein
MGSRAIEGGHSQPLTRIVARSHRLTGLCRISPSPQRWLTGEHLQSIAWDPRLDKQKFCTLVSTTRWHTARRHVSLGRMQDVSQEYGGSFEPPVEHWSDGRRETAAGGEVNRQLCMPSILFVASTHGWSRRQRSAARGLCAPIVPVLLPGTGILGIERR